MTDQGQEVLCGTCVLRGEAGKTMLLYGLYLGAGGQTIRVVKAICLTCGREFIPENVLAEIKATVEGQPRVEPASLKDMARLKLLKPVGRG